RGVPPRAGADRRHGRLLRAVRRHAHGDRVSVPALAAVPGRTTLTVNRPANALVLQHIACEPPGEYEDVLVEHGVSIHRVELDEGEPLPDRRAFDLIVAMGGPMSANDDDSLPWLTDEKRLISEAVRAGTPFWGACLGAQLLAASMGGRVYPGPEPEVGLLPVTLTEAGRGDTLFEGLPVELLTLQWHGDTFDLPEGAVR